MSGITHIRRQIRLASQPISLSVWALTSIIEDKMNRMQAIKEVINFECMYFIFDLKLIVVHMDWMGEYTYLYQKIHIRYIGHQGYVLLIKNMDHQMNICTTHQLIRGLLIHNKVVKNPCLLIHDTYQKTESFNYSHPCETAS